MTHKDQASPVHYTKDTEQTVLGVNWNEIPDPRDKEVWDRVVANFWVPEKIPVSNDLKSWAGLTEAEKLATMRVFTGLTVLDTIQGTVGAPSILPDSKTMHEEAVYTNFSFMEAFAAGTQLLTPYGWKNIEDITEDDQVAQYHPDENKVDFATPTVVDPHFSDEVYEISANNGNARQIVSGGHRVYLEEKEKKNNQCKDWGYRVVEARELKDINLASSHRRMRSAAPAEAGKGMSDVDRLIVAVNADGSIRGERYTGEETGYIPAHFSLKKERKINRLFDLAKSAGWKIWEIASSDDRRELRIGIPLEYVDDNRKMEFHTMWDLSEKSSTWCEEFVRECGLWDGHSHKDAEAVTFNTCNKADSDFFVAASTLAGFRSRTKTRVDERSETYSDSYVTYTSFTKDSVNTQCISINSAEPQMVYCVQVPSTFLVTRNGESPVISGNCIHAKSYSNIFMTLASTEEINEAFRWSENNEQLQEKSRRILDLYKDDDPHKRKIASVALESFLFYSGFYLPLRFATLGKLTNTADIIRLIIRDEAIHGYYIGYKYQVEMAKEDPETQEYYKKFVTDLLADLYEIESVYTEQIYDDIGWTEDVKTFLRYNANKAMNNMGYEGIFPDDTTQVSAGILSSLSPEGDENHDFFSGQGSSYTIGEAEDTDDDDWDW